MTADLQAAYRFLVDRQNRLELNLAKLGVVALGDGANLAAAWAASPGGAVSSEGRISDLGALVLVSPKEDADGLRLAPILNVLAPRMPILLAVGDQGADLAKAAQPVIERHRLSKVAFFDTRLKGYRLLQFEPKVVDVITKFLEERVKFRSNSDWEPRYLLNPVAYRNVVLVPDAEPDDNDNAPDAPARKAAAPAPAQKKANN